jgi:O-antigen/teichoic acid export membrane protein
LSNFKTSSAIRKSRIAKNTMALYVRQILILCVNLYSLRVVLDVLGIEDYGIYSVVAGMVTLLSFLPGTMASATQRYFSFALGQDDHEKLRVTFTVNWMLYAFIALVSLLVLESLGWWFVNVHLEIPAARFNAAQTLYHLAVFSFIASIFSSPFIAILVAHEDMHLYAYISIADAVMKLAIVFMLYAMPWDKLELYGFLLLAVSVVNAAIYIIVCLRRYPECQFRKIYWDKVLLKEILGFTSWTLFGQISNVMRYQAVTILLNQMFNPAVVAARAVAMTVAGQAVIFSTNFNIGLYPSIVKTYAENQKDEMFSLVFNGSKLTFFLMWMFTLPLLLEMETVLRLWLKNPPVEAAIFTQLALIESLIISVCLPIATAARAPGKMKMYELSLGCIQFGIFVGSWVVLLLGYAAYSVFIVAIGGNLLMFIIRLTIVNKLIGLPLAAFYRKVCIPIVGVMLTSAIPSLIIQLAMPPGLTYACLMMLLAMILACVSMYFVGLDRSLRKKVRAFALEQSARFKGVI